MYSCPRSVNNAIPAEYRKIAENLFPPDGFPAGKGPAMEAAAAFADILGIGSDYNKILTAQKSGAGGDIHTFLGHFRNNLDLLIQKTWVEKADEARKEKLQDAIPGFIAHIEAGHYQKALAEFGGILEELAYLFFGPQSHKDDFTEYAIRIDDQMGLFWWYGGQIGCLQPAAGNTESAVAADDECLKAVLFIGLCYLTNF
ncbi:MAG: hypothetical protein LBQ38_02665 [Spirochaetaceae bacterium]|jgi:hypothetical protein|nr:hypothetical protein [Spirochaetaceae bacterium]